MEEVLIEIKGLKHYPKMSEETECFNATIYINGISAGEVNNRGEGGPTNYAHHYRRPETKKLIELAEEWCRQLPDKTYGQGDNQFTIKMSLEHYLDDLVNNEIERREQLRFQTKIKKQCIRAIVFGNNDHYSYISFKQPLEVLMQHEQGCKLIKETVARVKQKELKEGEKILNTNLPKEWL